eukprot:1733054-Amphidinium_carterae.1
MSQVYFGLFESALRDPLVGKVVLLSADVVPLTDFSHVHDWAFRDEKTWLCMDHEVTRAEAFALISRRHLQMLVKRKATILDLKELSHARAPSTCVLNETQLGNEARVYYTLPNISTVGKCYSHWMLYTYGTKLSQLPQHNVVRRVRKLAMFSQMSQACA